MHTVKNKLVILVDSKTEIYTLVFFIDYANMKNVFIYYVVNLLFIVVTNINYFWRNR